MKLPELTQKVSSFISKNSPTILTGLGVAGVVTTAGLTVKATIPIYNHINDLKYDPAYAEENNDGQPENKAVILSVLKEDWKYYVPPIVVGTTSIACIIGANTVSNKKRAALAGAYSVAQTALSDYREEVVSTIGEKKEKPIREKAASKTIKQTQDDVINNNPGYVFRGRGGNDLFFDVWSGRYFTSDIETIRHIENDLNRQQIGDGYASIGSYYYGLGLPEVKNSDDMIWTHPVEFKFGSQLSEDGKKAAITIDFNIDPNMDTTNSI